MRAYEQIYDLIWILLGTGICVQSLRLGLWRDSGPSSGFVPFVTGLLIGLTGFILFVLERFNGSKKERRVKFWESRTALKKVIYLVGGLFALAYLMPKLGFLFASALVTGFILYVIEPQKWFTLIATTLLSILSVYLLFYYILQIPLPKSFLGI